MGSPPHTAAQEIGKSSSIFHGVDPATLKAMTRSLAQLRTVRSDSCIYKIDDRVYLGSLSAALDRSELEKHGITHIVCVARGIRSAYSDHFAYKQVHILDSASESLLDHLPDCLGWMAEALEQPENKILVHCFAGRSRSVAVVVAYLMLWHGVTLRAALLHVRGIRPVANPNPHFVSHLRGLEEELAVRSGTGNFFRTRKDLEAIVPGAKARVVNVVSQSRGGGEAGSRMTEFVAYQGTGSKPEKLQDPPKLRSTPLAWLFVLLLSAVVAGAVSATHRIAYDQDIRKSIIEGSLGFFKKFGDWAIFARQLFR